MKNKKFKKFIIPMLVAPCMFFAACGPTPPEDPKDTWDESDKTAAYTTLRTTINNFTVPTTDNKTAVEVNSREAMEMAFDFTNSGLDSQTKEMMQQMMPSGAEVSAVKESYGYSSDNTGYYVKKSYDETTQDYVNTALNLTKKSGTTYSNYHFYQTEEYDELEDDYVTVDVKTKSLVDDKYAPNTYKLTKDDMSETGKLAQIYGIFDSIKEHETYTDFKEDVLDLAAEMMEGGFDLSNAEDSNISIDITKSDDNVFTLTGTIDINQLVVENMGMEMNMNIDAGLTVKFDENYIHSAEMTADIEGGCDVPTNTMMQTTTYGQNDVVSIDIDMDMEANANFKAAFDNTVMNSDVTGYVGTGENDSIENRITNVSFEYVGIYDSRTESNTGKFDDDIDLDMIAEIQPLNVTVEGVYWDEACTDKVEEGEKYPSYDIKLYVKVTPNTEFAIVQSSYVYTSSEYTSEYQYEAKSVADVFEFDYLDSDYYDIEKIEVNGVEVDPEDYEDGLTLESGKIYRIKYYLADKEDA